MRITRSCDAGPPARCRLTKIIPHTDHRHSGTNELSSSLGKVDFCMNSYPSLNIAAYHLRKRGYTLDFYYKSGFIICLPLGLKLLFTEVEINEMYSFPAIHKAGMYSVIYAITTRTGIKGIVYDCCGSVNPLNTALHQQNVGAFIKNKHQPSRMN